MIEGYGKEAKLYVFVAHSSTWQYQNDLKQVLSYLHISPDLRLYYYKPELSLYKTDGSAVYQFPQGNIANSK